MSFLGFCEWLGNTRGSVALHGSLRAYPILESTHVLALCLFLGLAVMFDLRLVGAAMRQVPVSQVAQRLLPWIVAGFAVMVITGALLFYGIPVKTYQNVFFRAKMILLFLAGLNALVFHAGIYRRVTAWDLDPRPPLAARIAGFASLVFWSLVVVAGRMIAYDWFGESA